MAKIPVNDFRFCRTPADTVDSTYLELAYLELLSTSNQILFPLDLATNFCYLPLLILNRLSQTPTFVGCLFFGYVELQLCSVLREFEIPGDYCVLISA